MTTPQNLIISLSSLSDVLNIHYKPEINTDFAIRLNLGRIQKISIEEKSVLVLKTSTLELWMDLTPENLDNFERALENQIIAKNISSIVRSNK